MCVFFFFKQKTAYEMRISDWSSDVCSSDLCVSGSRAHPSLHSSQIPISSIHPTRWRKTRLFHLRYQPVRQKRPSVFGGLNDDLQGTVPHSYGIRSEENTSELQSLMRISYAVFCLKKKKHIKAENTMTIRSKH